MAFDKDEVQDLLMLHLRLTSYNVTNATHVPSTLVSLRTGM